MRKDMSKVIVERERIKGKYNRKGRETENEDSPKKQGMKQGYSDRKVLNENLKPLLRFFQSRVGKKWDKVFSEVCENIKLDSAVQKHVRDHVEDLVRLNVEKREDKRIYYQGRKYGGKFTELRYNTLYVDPDDGILKVYKKKEDTSKNKYWDYGLSDFLKSMGNEKSKMIIEDGLAYKMFYDKVSKNFTNKQKATKVHAENDAFNFLYSDRIKRAEELIKRNLLNKKDEYWETLISLWKEKKDRYEAQEKSKKESNPLKVGVSVSFKRSWDKLWSEGVIVERKDEKGGPTSYVIQTPTHSYVTLSGYISFQIKKKD